MKPIFLNSLYSTLFLLPGFLIGGCSTPAEKTIPKTYKVDISQMKFQPAELSVQKGDTVIFINHDFVIHNVTEKSSAKWSSPSLEVGKSWSLVVNEAADYYCTIHQVMKGKILVK